MTDIVFSIVGALAATFVVGLVVSIVLAVRKRLWYARRRCAIARICRDEIVIEEVRRGLKPPPRKWAVSIDFEEGDKPLIFLQVRGESARRIVDSVIPRLLQVGIQDYSFIAGPVAQASAEAHFERRQSGYSEAWPIVTPVDDLHVRDSARVIRRAAPGRKLAVIRWICGAETRELIDIIRADLARDRREMETEGRSRAFIWFQQTVVEWREIFGIAFRFLRKLVLAAAPLGKLIDRR